MRVRYLTLVSKSKGAAAAQAVKDLIMDAYQEADLRRQWNLYLKC